MKRFLRKFRYGEKGFTLIELLVVIAILGVLAAVVIPNVGRFIGSGTIEAANTETHNVQTAVLAYMVAVPGADPTGTVSPLVDIGNPPDSVKSFIMGTLQATYTINGEGEITDAVADATGQWAGLEWSAAQGWYEPAVP